MGRGRPSPSIQQTQGGVTVGINLGLVEVGISTDYGGAGKIGFGGQSVTWGLKGGRIQMGIAGFELIVEARDCVVTEIKKIAGMVVATRTYPDPGCKQPEAPKPPEQPRGEYDPLIPVGMDSTDLAVVLCDEIYVHKNTGIYDGRLLFEYDSKVEAKLTVENLPDTINYLPSIFPLIKGTVSGYGKEKVYQQEFAGPGGLGGSGLWLTCVPPPEGEMNFISSLRPNYYAGGYMLPTGFPSVQRIPMTVDTTIKNQSYILPPCVGANGIGRISSPGYYSGTSAPNVYGEFLYGQENAIAAYISQVNRRQSQQAQGHSNFPRYVLWRQLIVSKIIKLTNAKPKPKPEGGNRPPMNSSSCCKEILADLADLKEVLAADEMLKGKCSFPWRLRMPGGRGEEIIYDYPNFLRALAQEVDHLGIHPPQLYIKDNNNAQEGDQTVDIKFPSATSAFEALMRQVWDDNSDGDTRTNFLYRLAWLAIQNQEATIKLSAKIHAIADALGVELEVDTAKFPVPFNIAAGVNEKATRGQGFGKNSKPQIDSKIDINSELTTESLLPQFLKCRENEVLIERFAGSRDIIDILSLILMHVEKLNSK